MIQISTNTVIATIPGIMSPEQIAISPDGTRLFVVNLWLDDAKTHGGVTVVDAMVNQVLQTIPLGDASDGIAISPDDSAVYVTELNLNQVVKISTITYKVMTLIPVGARPTAIVITPNGAAAYVADSALFAGTPNIEEIKLSTNQVIAAIAVGTDPDALALSANEKLCMS